ncbi:aminopeptidase I zinc metalloprotease (M18) domain-containing protein [Ditylenchus destructor]|nr:aminopeptidase I zinc metalloprotease (M18) domain-containing protein [Ditylenchus destructor]
MTAKNKEEIRARANAFIEFLNGATTPYHAVQLITELLEKNGFHEVLEHDPFQIKPGDKCFIKKNHTTIIAFAAGGTYKPGNGFSIVGTHTDSCCLRVKPISKRESCGLLQVGISPYGGGQWHTWFDRDLSVAGLVIFKRNDSIVRKLIDLRRPILSVPSLAIHLDENPGTFEVNKESHLLPILATAPSEPLGHPGNKAEDENNCEQIAKEHHEKFLSAIAEKAGTSVSEMIDLDLYLYDTNKARITGINEEFISGARLDNLSGTYAAITGLLEGLQNDESFSSDPNVRLVGCYDNEEVGNGSAQGAASAFTEWVLRRLAASYDDKAQSTFECAIGKSLLISADQGHAVHPNYSQCHEENHKPSLNGGVLVKVDVNQRWATTSLSHAILKVIADEANLPLQKIVFRNDCGRGFTIGAIMSANLGMRTVDVGTCQLGMHSIREFAGIASIWHASKLYAAFFERFPYVLERTLQTSQ